VGERNKIGELVGHGNWSLQYLWELGLKDVPELSECDSIHAFKAAKPDSYSSLLEDIADLSANCLSLYHATGTSLRSNMCCGVAEDDGEPCQACSLLSQERSIRKRAALAVEHDGDDTWLASNKTNHKCLTRNELCALLTDVRQKHVASRLHTLHVEAENAKLKTDLGVALQTACESVEKEEYPAFIKNFVDAWKISKKLNIPYGNGLLNETLEEILEGISITLRNRLTRGRPLKENVRLFYVAILNTKGPWAHNLVSDILLGPSERNTKKLRAELGEGFQSRWHADRSIEGLKATLTDHGLEDAPGLLVEDGSSLLRRVDLERMQLPEGGLCVDVHGLDNNELLKKYGKIPNVHSVDELKELFTGLQAEVVATTMYVWAWVPQVQHAPWFPIRCEITNNKFD